MSRRKPNIILRNCSGSGNGRDGFSVRNSDVLFDNCIAKGNKGKGFSIENDIDDNTIISIARAAVQEGKRDEAGITEIIGRSFPGLLANGSNLVNIMVAVKSLIG